MADEPTTGEVYRRQLDHEQRTDRIHGELDDRITQVARDSVPLDVYQADQRARAQEQQQFAENVIKPLRDRIKALEDRPQMTLTNKLAGYGVIVAFLGVVVAAWAASKGAG